LQSKGFNWTGRDFELGKEVALYTIEIFKRRINGERIPIIKSLLEFLNQKVPDKSSNITKGTIGGLLHIPGLFSRIGFDARITTWLNKSPEVAIWELNTVKEKILNLKNFNSVKNSEEIDEVKEELEKLKEKINELEEKDVNEYDTAVILVERLLEFLEWNISDIDEVKRQKETISRHRVDYSLNIDGVPKIYIEVKRLQNKLKNYKEISQIVTYANEDGVKWGLITNGDKYHLYDPNMIGDLSNKLILEIQISENLNLNYLKYFKKKNIQNDTLSAILQKIKNVNIIKQGLENLFDNKKDNLIKLLKSGYLYLLGDKIIF